MYAAKHPMTTYLLSAGVYLSGQEALNAFAWYYGATIRLETFAIRELYLAAPCISMILVIAVYLLFRTLPGGQKRKLLFHGAVWTSLFVPHIVPPLVYGLNIIYTSWTFIMATAASGVVVFQDMAMVDLDKVSTRAEKFVYDEMRFYLDKFAIAWLTLGTVLAVCMTILWTAPQTSFKMEYDERVFWAVYMVFSFFFVTVLVGIFALYPILERMAEARKVILEIDQGTSESQRPCSGSDGT